MFTALDHCHEAIEITSDEHVIQVRRRLLSLDVKTEPFKFELPFFQHFPTNSHFSTFSLETETSAYSKNDRLKLRMRDSVRIQIYSDQSLRFL